VKKSYRWDLSQHRLIEVETRNPGPRVFIIPDIEPYVDDNMAHDPIYVRSRQHRNQLLKERGLTIK
jgi:hypothetical protein